MRPSIIAHRGASREYRENTLPAFERALELGAEGIELDVHATSDGVVVVHHDPAVRLAVGAGAGETRAIAELTMRELTSFSERDSERAPSLEEVLSLVGARADVYVELKGAGIEHSVVEVIQESSARHRCAIHSFDHVAVLRSRKAAPNIFGGILLASRLADPAGALRAAAARDYWIHWPWADAQLVDSIHSAGGRVIAWTPPDEYSFRMLAALGVDGICADDVRALRLSLEDA
ncbi:MAG: glycerophosphodiester phosphodiesterase [Anaerolineae bacterium]|nr:glycerophosphodiester phosphodiesterase [Gemmatimonadaceae bacterium]